METPSYLVAAKAAGLSDELRSAIVDLVAADALIGVELRGTGGCRKFRFAGRGKGKSGGLRVVHFYSGTDLPVFLLTVFGKNEKSNITATEAATLAVITKRLVDTHRPGFAEPEGKR